MSRNVKPTTPPDPHRLRLGATKAKAAGVAAAVSSLYHGITKMGVSKTVKTLRTVNQHDGFDCPGCAWPDPEHRTSFEFCENGAKAVADESMAARVDADFFARHTVHDLSSWSDHRLNRAGRLAQPMYLAAGANRYTPIEWDEALDLIAQRLSAMPSPERGVFYTSGRTSNEAAFLYQAMVRGLGTNNLPDCSNMCHESSGKGLGSTIGIGKGTVSLEDFNHANLIMVIGQNPGTNHPRMLTALRDAKHRGARIIHVNPLPEAGLMAFKHPQDYMKANFGSTTLADLHLPVRIGGDAALLKGLMKIMLRDGTLDSAFIEDMTAGFDALVDSLADERWSTLEDESGLTRAQIEQAGRMVVESKATIACWAMGLTQHRNGVAVIQEVVNLLLMGGHIGRPGAGLCPVRGHSNVQGDRTVGIWEAPTKSFLQRMEKGLGFPMPSDHGYDVVGAIEAMLKDKVDVFFCMGGNFLSATPDTNLTASALNRVGLTVQVSTKLNRSHLVTGDEALILPCLGRTEIDVQGHEEQFVTVENSMGMVHTSVGGLQPASTHLKSEPWIVAQLAHRCLPDAPLPWLELIENYDRIRDLMSVCLAGFDGYNERVRQPNGFALPNPPRDHRRFDTPDGKAHFTVHPRPNLEVGADRFVLMTLRSHDQYNTTIYGLHDRYRGIHGNRRVLMMNAEDMVERGWKARTIVNMTSHFEGEERHSPSWLLVPYEIPRGNLAAYFPEANELVPLRSTAALSNTPTSKWVVVSLKAASDAANEEEE